MNILDGNIENINKLILQKKISLKELANIFIEHYLTYEKKIGAFESFDPEYVIKQAINLDNKLASGKSLGKLFGIPIGIKDIFNTEYLPTKMGSKIWEDHYAGNNARVVSQIIDEDCVIYGKTVTAEFAVHHPGKTRNPHDITRTPGTSSSGSAAAVSSGLVVASLGTQTAGSLIRPASYCGIYAFKPTFGWIPRTGVLKTTDTLDQIGFFAKDPKDLACMFESSKVYGNNHILKEKKSSEFILKNKWNIGLAKTPYWNEVDEETKKLFLNIPNSMKNKNILFKEVTLPDLFSDSFDVHRIIYHSDLAYYFKDESDKFFSQMSEILFKIIKEGRKIDKKDYFDAISKQRKMIQLFDEYMTTNDLDFIFSLSANSIAPKEEVSPTKDSCHLYNMLGVPVISVPMFYSSSNMPIGLQVVGRKYSDFNLLEFINKLKKDGIIPKVKFLMI